MTVALDPHTGTDQWWVYDYFEGTLEIDRQRYPSCDQIREWMSDAGFVDTFSREYSTSPAISLQLKHCRVDSFLRVTPRSLPS